MSNIAIIPARGNSVRIPRKNIKPFYGRPIMAYAIDAIKQSGLFDRIIVSTEDGEIAEIATSLMAEIVIRPGHLAEVNAADCGTQEVVRHALLAIAAEDGDVACCVYPATPLLRSGDLSVAHKMLVLRPCSYVAAVATNPFRDIGNFYMGLALQFVNRNPLWNHATGLYVMPPERAIDINSMDDWKKAEEMYAKLREEK